MLDFAWSEMAVIAVVALIVLGPKELPHLLRNVGQWVAKARGLARDFQMQVDDMVRQAELDDLKKQVDNVGQQIQDAGNVDIAKEIETTVDPKGELSEQLKLPDLTHPDLVGAQPVDPAAPDSSMVPDAATGLTEPPIAVETRPEETQQVETAAPTPEPVPAADATPKPQPAPDAQTPAAQMPPAKTGTA